jgi:hypothetical protein
VTPSNKSNLLTRFWDYCLCPLVFPYPEMASLPNSSIQSRQVPPASGRQSRGPRLEPGPYFCTVFSYPCAGGFVACHCTGVELEWLGLPRSGAHADSFDDPEMEDVFALRVLRLGGRWWPSRKFCHRHSNSQFPYGHHYPPELDVGYSSTGRTLVLKTFAETSPWLSGEDVPQKPNDWSRLAACGTMDERCDVLRGFGAAEYDIREHCPDLPDSLETGIEEGKRYEALLTSMDDHTYLDQWLMGL